MHGWRELTKRCFLPLKKCYNSRASMKLMGDRFLRDNKKMLLYTESD